MLILASGSPRRKELLSLAGFDFKVITSNFDEESVNLYDPYKLVKQLAYQKASSVATLYPNDTILAADTIVIVNNEIYNKPRDYDEAYKMLDTLSKSKKHQVVTAVCIIYKGKVKQFVEKTTVYFNQLTHEEIDRYIKTNEPFDKAGGYGIQGKGSILIKKIVGDYYNVMGLPIGRVYFALKNLD